jgi:hypothetical protein
LVGVHQIKTKRFMIFRLKRRVIFQMGLGN